MQLSLSPQTWKVRAVSAGWDGMSLGFKEYEKDNDYSKHRRLGNLQRQSMEFN